MPSIISLYPHIGDAVNSTDTTVDLFVNNVRIGTWQDQVLPLRAIKDKADQQEAKKSIYYATISGKFTYRNKKGLVKHSGNIAIDVDNCDVNKLKDLLRHDPYVYACFVSCSGRGLCIIFRINGDYHSQAFDGLCKYLYDNYRIIADQSGKDITRARYVSFDPDLYENDKAAIFKDYSKREKKSEKVAPSVFVQSDFDVIIDEIVSRKIDVTGDYSQWVKIGFAISDKFGEQGRRYFHAISQFGNYDTETCDKQYTNCIESNGSGITIATLYHFCKNAGITIESEQTRNIKRAAYVCKKGTIGIEDAIKSIADPNINQIAYDPELTTDIVHQVYANNIVIDDVTEIECIRAHLREKYNLRINEVSTKLENDGKELSNYEVNSIEVEIKEKFPKADYTTIGKLLNSKAVPKYNPFFEFFERNMDRGKHGSIDELFSCIESTTGEGIYDDYVKYFGKKWLVGLIANLYKDVSPLMLILCGLKQGTGKTYFFSHLLPEEMREKYFTLKKLGEIKSESFQRDLDIAMSRYWLILDDEMSGKSRRDEGTIKSLLSATESNVRASYDRREEYRKRIATFAGTTNPLQILNDYTGNRRYIPIEVSAIDKERKDRINPVEYIMEAYHLYHSGFDFRILDSDMDLLNACVGKYTQVSTESEMITKFYAVPASDNDNRGVYRTGTDIKNKLEANCKDKMNHNKISAALASMGITCELKRLNKILGRWYFVIEKPLFEEATLTTDVTRTALPF